MLCELVESLKDPYDPTKNIQLMSQLCRTPTGALWASLWESKAASSAEILHLRALTEQPLDLEEIASCTEGTLGHRYFQWLGEYGIPLQDQLDRLSGKIDQPPLYIARLLKTHDLHHIVLDIPPTKDGEIMLQGAISALSSSPGPFEALTVPALPYLAARGHRGAFRAWKKGFDLGKALKGQGGVDPLVIPYEDLWKTQVSDICSKYNLQVTLHIK